VIETQWVLLPALFTGLYHWLIWVAQQQRPDLEGPPRERMTRARPAVLMAELQASHRWTQAVQAQQVHHLASRWAALQASHESMRQQSLQAVFAQQVQQQQARDHTFTLESILAGAQAGAQQLSNAPGRMVQVTGPPMIQVVPPLPGGPT
jgi:TolA-binding protein